MVQTVIHSVKADFNKLIRDPNHRNIILEAVDRAHDIKIHILQFLKEYLLFIHALYNDDNTNDIDYVYVQNGIVVEEQPDMEYPYETVLTNNLIDNISVIVCAPSTNGRPPNEIGSGNLRNVLLAFYNEYYIDGLGPTELPRTIPRTHLATYLDYFSTQVMTMYKNNISMHFKDNVKRYFEYVLGKEYMLFVKKENPNNQTQIELREMEIDWNRNYDLIVRDVLCMQFEIINDERVYIYQSDPEHHSFIERERRRILPQHVREAVNNFDLNADLIQHPLRYLTKMINMMQEIEGLGGKLYSIFPTIDTNIPGHILIDTTTLLNLLFPKKGVINQYIRGRTNNIMKGDTTKHGWLKTNIHLIWDLFFLVKENKHIFHGIRFDENGNPVFVNGAPHYIDNSLYTFHHQASTDGVSISFILVKKINAHELHPKNPPRARGVRDPEDVYIHQLSDEQKQQYTNHQIVGVDPNKRDIFYGINSNDKNDHKKMRYTSDQRKKEKKTKNNRRLMTNEKRETIVNNRNIEQHESDLSAHNSNTVDLERYRAYVLAKNICNTNTKEFYHRTKYRKRRFKTYVNTQKSESKFIKNIKKKFGGPDTTLIAIGDWNDGNHHRRFNEPVIGIGLRKILRKAKYKVFLVDEFRTSRMCSECMDENGINEKFRRVNNPRPWRGGQILCNGLLRCQTCQRLWNRDLNAAINIYNIAWNALHGYERPIYLQRPNQQNQNVNVAAVNEYDE
jgi:transposase